MDSETNRYLSYYNSTEIEEIIDRINSIISPFRIRFENFGNTPNSSLKIWKLEDLPEKENK